MDQVDRIAGLIAEFGFDQPIVVDEKGVIIKGHGRREAAIRLGLALVPVVRHEGLSDAQKKVLRIGDNKVAESEWKADALKLEFEHLREVDIDLDLTGFSGSEIDKFFEESMSGLPDEKPEIEFTEELMESSNYVVLYFDNDVDWLQALTLLDLRTVKDLRDKPGFRRTGIGRVISGPEAINRLIGGGS